MFVDEPCTSIFFLLFIPGQELNLLTTDLYTMKTFYCFIYFFCILYKEQNLSLILKENHFTLFFVWLDCQFFNILCYQGKVCSFDKTKLNWIKLDWTSFRIKWGLLFIIVCCFINNRHLSSRWFKGVKNSFSNLDSRFLRHVKIH